MLLSAFSCLDYFDRSLRDAGKIDVVHWSQLALPTLTTSNNYCSHSL